jgi:hypothetical protein
MAESGGGRKWDPNQSRACSESLRKRGLVRGDLTLEGPADAYSSSELWCYIHHLWVANRGQNSTLAAMSDGEAFSETRAVDVVAATLNNAGTLVPPLGLMPSHLHRFISLLTHRGRSRT